MKSINVEIIMGHTIGVSDSYYKPTDIEILEDYLKTIDVLTIDKDSSDKLVKEIDELRNKNENNEHIIRSKLQEKNDALTALSDHVMKLTEQIENIKRIIPDEKK
jgi:hypothetical protein